MINHGQPVAQAFRLVHEVRGQDQRLAAPGQLLEAIPDQVARLRIKPGRRLVEKNNVRVIHQGSRQGQSPLHPAGKRLDARLFLASQASKIKQIRNPRTNHSVRQAEIATEDQQVFGHRKVGIDIVELWHHAHPLPCDTGLRRNRAAAQDDLAGTRLRQPEATAQGGRLARAIGTEQAKTGTWRYRKTDTGQHLVAIEALMQRRDAQGVT